MSEILDNLTNQISTLTQLKEEYGGQSENLIHAIDQQILTLERLHKFTSLTDAIDSHKQEDLA